MVFSVLLVKKCSQLKVSRLFISELSLHLSTFVALVGYLTSNFDPVIQNVLLKIKRETARVNQGKTTKSNKKKKAYKDQD